MTDNKKYRGIRRTARILGTAIVAFVLFLVLQEYIEELRSPDVSPGKAFVSLISSARGMLFEWILCTIAVAGLVLAFWKEGLGGGIALVCFIWLFVRLGWGHFNIYSVAPMIIVSIPCVLYIIYGWNIFRQDRR